MTTKQWAVQLHLDKATTPGVAAAPHYYDYEDSDEKQTVHNRIAQLHAHGHIQRQKKNLMLLKCTVTGVSRTTLRAAPPAELDAQTAALYCNESMLSQTTIVDECWRGQTAVLKVRQPAADFQVEGTNMLRMLENDTVAALIPVVHAFLKFDYDGRTWGGMCTGHYDWCVNSIVYPGPNAKLQAAYARDMPSTAAVENNQKNRGVPVRFAEGRTLQTAVFAACMELLQRMHSAGWVHGDTHLGNFMLDSERWRVVGIDVERSFESMCPRQHLLDMQELFGHATGLLVSHPCTNLWDMRDVLGVMVRIHPGAQRKRCKRGLDDAAYDALRLLPMCLCFTCDKVSDRIEGCYKCNTCFFNDIVAHYASNPKSYVDSLLQLSLEQISVLILEARAKSHASLRAVSDPLLALMRASEPLRMGIHMPDTIEGSAHFDDWVSDMLFLGVVERHDDAKVMLEALRKVPEGQAVAEQLIVSVMPRMSR